MTKVTVELNLTPKEVEDILDRRFVETRDLAFNRARKRAASILYSAFLNKNGVDVDGNPIRTISENDFQNLYADISHMKD